MILEICVVVLSVLFLLHWRAHSYWKRRNVFSLTPEFFFGNIKPLVQQKPMTLMFNEIYKKHKKQGLVGFYSFYNPMLFATDPEIVKRVLVTDFNCFFDNGFILEKSVDPMLGISPFTAKGMAWWKEMRSIQTTIQTPLKLKEFVSGIVKVANSFCNHVKKQNNQPVLIKDVATRLTIGAAVVSAYGVEPKTFTDPEFGFMKHASGEKLFSASNWSTFAPLFIPSLLKIFNIRITSKESQDFFVSMTSSMIEHRESSKQSRGDLIDSIVKLNKKKIEQNKPAYTPVEMAGHCINFYLDATVTSAEVMCFLMLELANHLDVQEKLRDEIASVIKKPEDLDFDKINSLPYLQMVLDEVLRLHAPVAILTRLCTKDVTIGDVKIPKGTKVIICPYSFQRDPEYYPEPDKFMPERFSEENKQSLVKYTYLPFGEGPRICVGMKYAILVLKLSIANILLNYRILSTNGQKKVEHCPTAGFILTPPVDATLKFEELNEPLISSL